MGASSGNGSDTRAGGPARLPMDLCDSTPEWHRWVARQVDAAGTGTQDAEAALRAFVREQFGPDALDTHDWDYTPGSGRMLDHLLASVPREQRGAVLPAYQRVAAALPHGAPVTSTDVTPVSWSRARFTPPARQPAVLVVNPLHANPLAVSLPPGFVTEVADYARRTGVLLVEDDPFRSMDPEDHRSPALVSLHPHGTVHLGSWTKVLGWPVKVGFVGWPRRRPGAGKLRATAPAPEPSTIEDLVTVLSTGRADTIRSRRHALLTSRRTAVTALLRSLDRPFVTPTGGAHLALLTHQDVGLGRVLRAERIGGLDAAHFYPRSAPRPSPPFLRLGLSNATERGWDTLLAALERTLTAQAVASRDIGRTDGG